MCFVVGIPNYGLFAIWLFVSEIKFLFLLLLASAVQLLNSSSLCTVDWTHIRWVVVFWAWVKLNLSAEHTFWPLCLKVKNNDNGNDVHILFADNWWPEKVISSYKSWPITLFLFVNMINFRSNNFSFLDLPLQIWNVRRDFYYSVSFILEVVDWVSELPFNQRRSTLIVLDAARSFAN
jgi:hypothetical protein